MLPAKPHFSWLINFFGTSIILRQSFNPTQTGGFMQMRLSVLAAICAASIPAVSLAEPPPNWSYTGKDGAEHWGDLSPVYAACRLGKNQSPVDLSDIKTTRDNSVKFHYEPLAFNVENNGHTIQVTPEESAQTLHLGNKAFTFKQFHFHTPSEHTFHAKYFPMEAHFVHQSDAGELAVLGVMFKEGEENPALQPLMPFIDDKAPKKPRSLKVSWSDDGCLLHWKAPKGKGWENEAYKYVVYRFGPDEEIDLDNPTKIVAITYQPAIRLNYNGGETKYTYVVTALDRMSNESVGKKKKIRL